MAPKNDAERALQMKAAVTWSVWEGVISHLIPDTKSAEDDFGKDDYAVCFAQIEAHYFAKNLFLPPNYIVDHASNIAQIPTHIVHGRFDLVCPLPQAEALVAALKKAGAEPASYIKTTAGHSMLERENCLALTEIMEHLPVMKGFVHKPPAPHSKKNPHP